MKTLVWLTHSFRLDSRLTANLSGPCTFVYYSPYYFAGDREREILKGCSTKNLQAFYQSLDEMQNLLLSKGHQLIVFKEKDPIAHINQLISKYEFERVVIDLPLFGMWKTTDPMLLSVPFEMVDSDLIDDECLKMTAKSRWMSHTRKVQTEKLYEWNSEITPFAISEKSKGYPTYESNSLIDPKPVIDRALHMATTYGQTRDKHDGQTRLSTAFQNGVIDPHNTFYKIARLFDVHGADFTKNEGAHAAMLRQFAFREMTIIQTRRANLTMEDQPIEWARQFLTPASLQNMQSRVNEQSTLTLDLLKSANTGDTLIDKILSESYSTGVMPNRARMFFAGWMFYNAPSGILALEWLIHIFDQFLLDGQCPTNYTQCTSSMNMQYGKVMLLNRDRVKQLLNYENI